MARHRVSIKEVAEKAGVSTTTVSLVLNNKGRISPKTRKRVTDAANTLGFIPDRNAAKLRSGQSTLLGVIVNDTSNPFFAELSAALEEEAFSKGYLTVVSNSNDDIDRQSKMVEAMVGIGVEGIIICPAVGSTPDAFAPIRSRGIPYVICVRDIQDMEADFIGGDDHQCGVLAAEHLCGLGHKHVAMVGGLEELRTWQNRVAGFREGLARTGAQLPDELILTGLPTRDFGKQSAGYLLSEQPQVTAIFCYNDIVAIGAGAALRENGKRIGEEISLISIDNLPESEATVPALTTVEMHPRSIGRRSARALINAISGDEASRERVHLAAKLIIRESCGPVHE